MKVFVAGATGRVAEFLMKDLLDQGHEVIAGARRPEAVIQAEGIRPVAMDLTGPVDDLVELVKGVDAIYFTAGSRGKDLLQTDAFGAVKLAQAAEAAGVQRFIMLSSLDATKPENWGWYEKAGSGMVNYIIAKFFADNYVINQTKLNYTILQPTVLVESEKADGQVSFGITEAKTNSIPNVALVLAELLEAENTYKQVITMSDGDQEIAQALASI